MTRTAKVISIFLTAMLASAGLAAAQSASIQHRAFIAVNGAYQATNDDFDTSAKFPANVEDATFTTKYKLNSGPALDISGGVFLWPRLALGVGITRFSRGTPSSLDGAVPHPFFFDRPRLVSGDVSGLDRKELAIHVQARVPVPTGSRIQTMVFGGPSFVRVTQGIVTNFTWTESYPFDEATFGTAATARATGSKVGFNVGVDIAVFFNQLVGVGGTVQFSRATVEVESGGIRHDVKAGGPTIGAGLRLRFWPR